MNVIACSLLVGGLIQVAAAQDTPADFRGMVKVASSAGQPWYAAGTSQDLPHPDFVNRFHVVLLPEDPGLFGDTADRVSHLVRVSATSKGTMTIEIVGLVLLEFFPAEVSIRNFLARAAPASETRTQYVTFNKRGDDSIEVLIEEPER